MQKLSKKTEHFTDSVIRRMTRVAYQYDSINLSQGFPDFAPPEMLLKRLGETAEMPDVHQYSITFGDPGFRRALAEKQSRFMGIDIDPDTEITAANRIAYHLKLLIALFTCFFRSTSFAQS